MESGIRMQAIVTALMTLVRIALEKGNVLLAIALLDTFAPVFMDKEKIQDTEIDEGLNVLFYTGFVESAKKASAHIKPIMNTVTSEDTSGYL